MQDSPVKSSSSIIVASILAIILCIIGMVAIANELWVMNSRASDQAVRNEAPDNRPEITLFILQKLAAAQKTRLAGHCVNCGVVVSITNVNDSLNKSVIHQVEVRMDNGTSRVISQQYQPVFDVDEKVKIVNGVIVPLERAKKVDDDGMFKVILTALSDRFF
ncbi:MAG TPA: hypothetical protein VEG25_00455 [Burkholderiales bacterium]|nr:hypothetical protein [Burkholderiales bacterium]